MNEIVKTPIKPPPYQKDMRLVPPINLLALLTVGGIQPLLGSAAEACDFQLSDPPQPDEIKYYSDQGNDFQLVFIVLNGLYGGEDHNGNSISIIYSITLVPATKKGKQVSQNKIDYWMDLTRSSLVNADTAFTGLNIFSGEWDLWGKADGLLNWSAGTGNFEQIGIVYDYFLLNTKFEKDDVCAVNIGDLEGHFWRRYIKRRSKLLFTPFETYKARQIWGVETNIELIMLRELVARGHLPFLQVMIFTNGEYSPSLYQLWYDGELQSDLGIISEVDFYFPDQRVAIFCDGAGHKRKAQKRRDEKIDAQLLELDIISIRVISKNIATNLQAECDEIDRVLGARG